MYSSADAGKQLRARELYREYSAMALVVVSRQVVQEFFVAALRKLASRGSLGARLLRHSWTRISLLWSPLQIRTAMDLEERYGISFWDALIIAAAQSAAPRFCFTET